MCRTPDAFTGPTRRGTPRKGNKTCGESAAPCRTCKWFWHRKAKAETDGRIYNYWNAEETWARIRDSAMAALKRYEAMNGGGEA